MDDQELYEMRKEVAIIMLHLYTKLGYSKTKSSIKSKLEGSRKSFDNELTVAILVVEDTSKGKTTDAILKFLDKEQYDMPDIYNGVDSIRS